jgi:cation-transporting P-type ATPase E
VLMSGAILAQAFLEGFSLLRTVQITAVLSGLVPYGLFFLIALAYTAGAGRIAACGALVQQVNAVESVSNVDVVCTDKTGTLTEPTPRVLGLVPAEGTDNDALARELASFAAGSPSRNLTLEAIHDARLADVPSVTLRGQVPFSSRRRWSALDLDGTRLFLGAPELFANADQSLKERAQQETRAGRRVLELGRSARPLPAGSDPSFPEDVRALGLVLLAERLRPNAAETVAFFADQHVVLKVLSGDAPATAGAIAHDAGVPGSAAALNGEALPSEPAALRDAVLDAPAVGRISPDGKRAVVGALNEAGRYVAMVGDGVNDVPALKEARLAIAQGSGTQIARSVADLVLVRDDFGAVPGIVGDGRQILRNIQRVARLFVTKSVFTAVVVLAVGIPTATYPLLPRQFTIASTVTIGIPAFLLALAPSEGPWRPEHFLRSVAGFAIPAGVAIGLGIVAGYLLARYGFDLGLTRSRTVATGIVVVGGLAVVLRLERRRGRARLILWGLCAAMLALFALALAVPFLRRFYELATPTGDAVAAWAVGTVTGVGGMLAALRLRGD